MTEEFTLTILKIEGLNEPTAQFTLHLNDKPFSSFPLSSLPVSIQIQPLAKLSLTITDPKSLKILSSILFNSQLLSCNWFYWLPLLISDYNNQSDLTAHRVLLSLNKETTLDSETSPKEPINIQTPDLLSHYKQMIKDLELELYQAKETCKQKCANLKRKVEKFKETAECEKKYRIDLMLKLEKMMKIVDNRRLGRNKDLKVECCEEIGIFPEVVMYDEKLIHTLCDETEKIDLDLETRVKETLSRLKFEGLLKKCKELNYRIGGKVITLYLKHGEIFCKNGFTLERYLFHSCKKEIESHLRQKSGPKKAANKSPNFAYLRSQRLKDII